jgi:hypothetical protein
MRVTGGSNKRVSLAALLRGKPGCRTRLIYRVHADHGHGKDRRQGFTDAFLASAGLDLAPFRKPPVRPCAAGRPRADYVSFTLRRIHLDRPGGVP